MEDEIVTPRTPQYNVAASDLRFAIASQIGMNRFRTVLQHSAPTLYGGCGGWRRDLVHALLKIVLKY